MQTPFHSLTQLLLHQYAAELSDVCMTVCMYRTQQNSVVQVIWSAERDTPI